MSITRVIWYSVTDDVRYELRVSFARWRHIAVEAAEDFHSNHDGWEHHWPLDITLYESEEGPSVATFEVERETVPQFHAWERSTAARRG